jgi:hypothetical protein
MKTPNILSSLWIFLLYTNKRDSVRFEVLATVNEDIFFLLDLLLNPDDGGNMSLRNV